MLKRVPPREDAGVRWERHDGMGVGEVEADAFTREPIERRRRCRTAVASQRVGAERVDRDEQDVLAGNRTEIDLRRRTRARARENEHNKPTRSFTKPRRYEDHDIILVQTYFATFVFFVPS